MNVKKERVLHHGTLLFDTALDDLKGVLAGSRHMIETKAVKSVSSPVVNIKAIDPGLSMDALIDGIVDAFLDRYPAVDPVRVDTAEAAAARNDIREKYTDWEWTFGRTPQCSVYSDAAPNGGDSRIILHVEKGCIRAVEGLPLPTALEARLAGLPLRCSAVEALLADPALIDGGGSSLRMFSAFLKDLAQF
jgi:lipoate-protein ligase A